MLTDHPDMTIAVDWDVKHQTKQSKSATIVNFVNLMFLLSNCTFVFSRYFCRILVYLRGFNFSFICSYFIYLGKQ